MEYGKEEDLKGSGGRGGVKKFSITKKVGESTGDEVRTCINRGFEAGPMLTWSVG